MLRHNAALMINIKDPYAWIVSQFAWQYKKRRRETLGTPQKLPVTFKSNVLRRKVREYNGAYRNWMRLGVDTCIIRYESLFDDLGAALYEPMAKLLGVQPTGPMCEKLPDYDVWTDVGGVDKVYYPERHYFDLLTPTQIRQITDTVAWPLFEGIYEPV